MLDVNNNHDQRESRWNVFPKKRENFLKDFETFFPKRNSIELIVLKRTKQLLFKAASKDGGQCCKNNWRI
jgi:hypothetical protein